MWGEGANEKYFLLNYFISESFTEMFNLSHLSFILQIYKYFPYVFVYTYSEYSTLADVIPSVTEIDY